jgi:hypothetical protein
MRTFFLCALILCVAGTVYPKDKKKDALELELQSLNETLQGVRDSLESATRSNSIRSSNGRPTRKNTNGSGKNRRRPLPDFLKSRKRSW